MTFYSPDHNPFYPWSRPYIDIPERQFNDFDQQSNHTCFCGWWWRDSARECGRAGVRNGLRFKCILLPRCSPGIGLLPLGLLLLLLLGMGIGAREDDATDRRGRIAPGGYRILII
jgi:hypothetical protein